jgi:regulator of cell morphogenesis and NO signaling
MQVRTLAAALEREHRDIDAAIEAFTTAPTPGNRQRLTRAIQTLRRHIYLEEEFLFPPLYRTGLAAPVLHMLREHGQIWTTLDSLEHALASGTSDTTRLCRPLSVQLQHHNLREEKVVYPRSDQTLTDDAAGQLLALLDSGKLPAGWVCVKARTKHV